jgi:hypothetical protein
MPDLVLLKLLKLFFQLKFWIKSWKFKINTSNWIKLRQKRKAFNWCNIGLFLRRNNDRESNIILVTNWWARSTYIYQTVMNNLINYWDAKDTKFLVSTLKRRRTKTHKDTADNFVIGEHPLNTQPITDVQ